MGGRGASSGGGSDLGGGGGGGGVNILNTSDLTSQREGKQQEVDDTLEVLRNVNEDYGYIINGTVVAKLSKGSRAMAYYDPSSGEIGVNEKYFDSTKLNKSYDDCVQSNYHPARGNKSAMEATISHEAGHALAHEAARKQGLSAAEMEKKIVSEAFKANNKKAAVSKAKIISGYAATNNAECIAEAFSDVYCNGKKAKSESKTVVKVLNKYLR